MTLSGDVELTILDGGGSVVVPSNTVQVVMGTCSGGVAPQILVTRNINTLVNVFGYGPLVEAAAMVIAKGGTVIAVKVASNAAGTATAVTFTGTGTSVITVTGAPYDTYDVMFKCTTGGTIGTAGIRFQVSLDGGRTFGPVVSLGTANTFVIPQTNITLNFAAGTLVANDVAKFSTVEPTWNTAGVLAGLNTLQASAYAIVGWGSMHIVGAVSGSNATTINGYLNTYATAKIFTRAIMNARDAIKPVAWGGAGETEATWSASLTTDFASCNCKRLSVGAGHYNMSSQIPNPVAGAPNYRRPLAFAYAARQVTIAPQRHAGRVKDGSLSDIVIDALNDPNDGFIYHDERLNPTFDAARLASATTRLKLPGYYLKNPNLLSETGSVFQLLPHGIVMDIACGIVTQVGQQDINDDIRLNKNGTIFENDALAIERKLSNALDENMVAKSMLSDEEVAVDRSNNVRTTKEVNIAVTIFSRGYILQENITIGYGNTSTAAAAAPGA